MNEPNNESSWPEFDIPKQFYSSADGKMFTRCIQCDRNLIADDVPYFIEKAYKKYPEYETEDVVFEYALCEDCAHGMRQKMSSESLQNMQQYFQERMQDKDLHMLLSREIDPGLSLGECMITGKPVDELQEYQLAGYFKGNKLVMSHSPFILSGEAMDEIMEILSEETKGEMDDFKDNLTGIPPELKDLFKDRPVGVM